MSLSSFQFCYGFHNLIKKKNCSQQVYKRIIDKWNAHGNSKFLWDIKSIVLFFVSDLA